MDLGLKGKRAIVSGGSRGIGRAAAHELALEGASVVITARHRDTLEATAKQLRATTNADVVPLTVDTNDDGSVRSTFARAIEELGGVDILVNSAFSVSSERRPSAFSDVTEEDVVTAVNAKVMGYLRTVQAVAPYMISQRWGRIVNIGGLSARQTGSIVQSVRNISVSALTKNLADELGEHGINVTVVHPGLTLTEGRKERYAHEAAAQGLDAAELERRLADNAIGRALTSQEVAWVIAFLASPRSVAMTGDAVSAGGGRKRFVYY